jgi:hypothetical protein
VTVARPRRVSVGRIVHYWSYEGDRIAPNAAMVVALGDEPGRVYLEVFWAKGFGGRDRVWAPCAPFADDGAHIPTDGHWTWPERV